LSQLDNLEEEIKKIEVENKESEVDEIISGKSYYRPK